MLKKELICIKNIFIKQEEAANDADDGDSEDEDEEKKGEGDEESASSDLSSQLHFSTPLCK